MSVFPRSPLLAALLAAMASLPAHAARQPIGEAPLSGDTEFHCRFGQDNSTECVSTYRYTILTLAGRELVSRIDRSYAENDSLKVERAELIQPGEKPVPLSATQIDTRMAPNPDQGFLRQKQTSLAFPNLRVGSTIVYTLRERFAGVPSATQFHYLLDLQPRAVRQERFRAEFSADRPMVWRGQAMDDYRIEATPDAKHITVALKAPPYYYAYVNESDRGYLRQAPRLEIGSSDALQDYFGPFAKRYNAILSAALPPNAAAAVAAQRGQPGPQAVAGLMRHLHEHYRYLGDWRSSERGQIPFALDEIERRGYGDCKDLAVLLVAMLRAAGIEAEPALVGPWTMGRDKKNPKPLDVSAFHTLVKTASEVVRRHEQQLHAQLNKSVHITTADGQRLRVALAIVPDEEGATATLSAQDELGEEVARASAPPTFKLTPASAAAWAEGGFQRVR